MPAAASRFLTPTPIFHHDLKLGNATELLLLQLLTLQGVPCFLNPSDEYSELAAYDINVDGEEWDVKSDWLSFSTGNICIEKASLEHTRSTKFAYLLPNTSGVYFHILPVQELVTLYNAQIDLPPGDGTYYRQYLHTHKVVGEQANNEAVILPKSITEAVGQSLWQEIKELTKD